MSYDRRSMTALATAPTVPSLAPRRAVLTPAIDTLAIGGASIVLFLGILLAGSAAGQAFSLKRVLILEMLLNWPHFTASWVLLYGSRETFAKHKWAAIHVPVVLVAYGAFALAMATRTNLYLDLSGLVASCYLAVHYTGQAWGMVATSTYLEGMPVVPRERQLIRTSLWIFLGWQVAWNLHFFGIITIHQPTPLETKVARAAFVFMSTLAPLAIALGVAGFVMLRRRVGRVLPPRVFVPWLAICLWYAAIGKYPNAIYWVQIAHATQYMLFPLRVESNRYVARAEAAGTPSPAGFDPRHALHMALYVVGIVTTGWLIYGGVDLVAPKAGPLKHLPFMVSNIVNIHHYFTDGVVWKIRNPAVRRELFAHLTRA